MISRATGALKPAARHVWLYAGGFGGAVYSYYVANVDFTSCTFDRTHSVNSGGAVGVQGGDVHFTSCHFVQTEAGANDCAVLLSWGLKSWGLVKLRTYSVIT